MKTRCNVVLAVLFIGAFVFASSAGAGIVMDQGFDDAGVFPPDSGGWYGDSSTTAGRWGDFAYPSGPYVTNSDSYSGSQSLKVIRGAGRPIGYVLSAVNTDVFEVSYAVKPVTNGSSACVVFLSPGSSIDFALALYVRDNGNVQYYNGSWTDTGAAVAMGQWSTIKQVATVSTNTWDLYVDGSYIDTFNNTVYPILPGVARIHFYPQGPAGNVTLFDDIQITAVPEPATMALLGLGSLIMFRRRAKKS